MNFHNDRWNLQSILKKQTAVELATLLNYFLIDFLFLARKSSQVANLRQINVYESKCEVVPKNQDLCKLFCRLAHCLWLRTSSALWKLESGLSSCSWVCKAMFTLSYYCVYCHVFANLLFYSYASGSLFWNREIANKDGTQTISEYFPSISRFFNLIQKSVNKALSWDKITGGCGKSQCYSPSSHLNLDT